MKNQKIKQWYLGEYPSDDLGEELNADVSFQGLFEALDSYKDVYDFLGVWDSVIRERVFAKLAEIMEVNYDYVYQQWLRG